jgi:hypothetical protein
MRDGSTNAGRRGLLLMLLAALLVSGCAKSRNTLRAPQPVDEPSGLPLGAAAPEIAGEDLDGLPFKLSDYRGQVVLLDFWGNW